MNPQQNFYPISLAVDVGFGHTKVVWGQEGDAAWSEMIFRSVCPRASTSLGVDRMAEANRVAIEVGDKKFFVGPDADKVAGGLQALNPQYIHTPEYEALLCGAWHYMMRDVGIPVARIEKLVLGLPVAEYSTKRETLRDIGLRSRRIPLPAGMVSGTGNDWINAVAAEVLVVPQPLGMMVYGSELLGNEDIGLSGFRTLAIDPGHYTFDWLVTDGTTPLMDVSSSVEGGVARLLKKIARSITNDHGGVEMDTRIIESALASGRLNMGHKLVDMEAYRKVGEEEAELVVDLFLQSFNPSFNRISKILLSGGGASLYLPALQARLPLYDIQLLPGNAMCNARGYYLYSL